MLNNREESLDKLMEWLSVFLDFKLESLEDGLEGAKGGCLIALIVRIEALLDLVLSVLSPGSVVELGDVVDDVLNATNNHLASSISQMHHVV